MNYLIRIERGQGDYPITESHRVQAYRVDHYTVLHLDSAGHHIMYRDWNRAESTIITEETTTENDNDHAHHHSENPG